MNRFIGIGEAAKTLGVFISTLRRWDAERKLKANRAHSGHRRYDMSALTGLAGRPSGEKPTGKTIA